MHQNSFRTKLRARIAAFLGMLPGLFFLLVTQTDFGKGVSLRCGYWMVLLFGLGIVWFAYAVFVKRILYDFRAAYEHSVDPNQKHHFQIGYYSTIFEALIASLIVFASAVGFLLVDLRCFLGTIL